MFNKMYSNHIFSLHQIKMFQRMHLKPLHKFILTHNNIRFHPIKVILCLHHLKTPMSHFSQRKKLQISNHNIFSHLQSNFHTPNLMLIILKILHRNLFKTSHQQIKIKTLILVHLQQLKYHLFLKIGLILHIDLQIAKRR